MKQSKNLTKHNDAVREATRLVTASRARMDERSSLELQARNDIEKLHAVQLVAAR
ncbi:MAG: hypothetical protein HW418_4276 [Anaerolineales bacterium]|nr:hypothetical protein [Anaerolineales bacterium]